MRKILVMCLALAALVPVGSATQPAQAASAPEECGERRLYKTLWCDDFDALDTSAWTIALRGGTATILGDELAVRANTGPLFPTLYRSSAGGPIFPPANVAYELEVKFRYVSVGSNGAGFYSLAGSTRVGAVHQDTSGFGATTACGSAVRKSPNTVEHIVRYTVEPGPGTRVHLTTLSSSPTTVQGAACAAAPTWPTAFLIGHQLQGGNFAWSNINVDYVRVDVPCRETGTASTHVATAHGVARGVAPAAADAVQDLNCDAVVANGL